MNNSDIDYVWKFKINTDSDVCNTLMEDTISFMLNSILKYVILTFNGIDVNINGFRYIKDKGSQSIPHKILNITDKKGI